MLAKWKSLFPTRRLKVWSSLVWSTGSAASVAAVVLVKGMSLLISARTPPPPSSAGRGTLREEKPGNNGILEFLFSLVSCSRATWIPCLLRNSLSSIFLLPNPLAFHCRMRRDPRRLGNTPGSPSVEGGGEEWGGEVVGGTADSIVGEKVGLPSRRAEGEGVRAPGVGIVGEEGSGAGEEGRAGGLSVVGRGTLCVFGIGRPYSKLQSQCRCILIFLSCSVQANFSRF